MRRRQNDLRVGTRRRLHDRHLLLDFFLRLLGCLWGEHGLLHQGAVRDIGGIDGRGRRRRQHLHDHGAGGRIVGVVRLPGHQRQRGAAHVRGHDEHRRPHPAQEARAWRLEQVGREHHGRGPWGEAAGLAAGAPAGAVLGCALASSRPTSATLR